MSITLNHAQSTTDRHKNRHSDGRRIVGEMGVEDIEARALRLPRRDRARLALRLLESLETLTDDENAAVWAEEAQRRSDAWDADRRSAGRLTRCSATRARG